MVMLSDKLPRWIIWAAGIFLFCLFVWAIRGILFPFVAGLAVAYLLDPIVDKLEARKVPRGIATAIVLALFFGSIIGIGFIIAPLLQDQISSLIRALPGYFDKVRPFILQLIDRAGGAAKAQQMVGDASGKIFEFATAHIGAVLAQGAAVFNIITLILVSPVVAFYMLRDWDIMTVHVSKFLPRQHIGTINMLMEKSDASLSGFVRGQSMVCLCLGVMYATGWSLVGLQYGLVLGMLAGLLAFVPTVGAAIGSGLAVIVAIGQFGPDYSSIGLVVLVFIIAQAVEGNFLVPKLVGDKIGLHAVWVMFALFVGGELMGLTGIFIAVPFAAVVAVVARWAGEQYLESHYFDPEQQVPKVEKPEIDILSTPDAP
jgi:predicted PurR-regulated permease PerM